MDENCFARRMRQLRMEKNWSPEECAKLLDIHRSTIVRYEKGDRFPSFQLMVEIARLFMVSTDYLLGLTDRRDEKQLAEPIMGVPVIQPTRLKDGQLTQLPVQRLLDFEKESDLIFLRIEDQKYLPAYSSRDLLVFKRNLLPNNGDIILWSHNRKTEIKTFYQRTNGIILVGIAPYEPPEWIDKWNQSETLGVLTHVIRGIKKT